MRIASLIAGLVFSVASVVPASAEVRSATSIKKPSVLGSRVSTVTTYRRGFDGNNVNCSATCSSSGRTHYWQCERPRDGYPVHCHINCSARPVDLQCLYE
jgi:hypothetical protein